MWHIEDTTDEAVLAKIDRFEQADGSWAGPFENLRCCLFYVQRRIRWLEGSSMDEEGRACFTRLYQAVCDAWSREAPANLEKVRRAYAAHEQR